MRPTCEVLVVGAGPVGLTLACHLRRLGLSIRIIDKRPGPSVHSKAIGLQYRVSEILARLGIVDRFLEQGASPTTVNLYAIGRRLLQLRFTPPEGVSGRDAFSPRAILIPQSWTEAILLQCLAELGTVVEWESELIDFNQHPTGVVARVQSSGSVDSIATDWLVSCEGAHSTIRKQLGIGFHGKTYPLAFFMADVHLDGSLAHGENHVWLHPAGSFAALPLPTASTWRLFIEVTRERDGHQTPSLGAIQRFMSERAAGIDARIVGEPLWLADFRINCRMVDRMHHGRVFLAGDAAHVHSPTGGQGIATGVQDAVNLAWKVARVQHGAPAALIDTYDEERLPHAAEVLRETDRTTVLLFAPTAMLRVLRDAVVLPVLRSKGMQRRLFGKLSQLHVHYRGSSLSRDHRPWWRRRRVRAGDRAPDVSFTDARSGTQTTLFALMSSLRPVVIARGENLPRLRNRLRALHVDLYPLDAHGATSRRHGDVRLIDTFGDFESLFGVSGDFLCLIRPDGHVGLMQEPVDERRLSEYLGLIADPAHVRRVCH